MKILKFFIGFFLGVLGVVLVLSAARATAFADLPRPDIIFLYISGSLQVVGGWLLVTEDEPRPRQAFRYDDGTRGPRG